MGFAYDANGRMVKATRENTPDALSVYDAAGMRVAERVNDVWRFLVYDIGGKLIAEYGGPQSTDEGGVKYVLSDWQGSTRCVVSNSGNVMARNDFTAFGEEISAGVGLRTATQGFGSNNTLNQKYAMTQRDDATGLDHTWFRKHENQAGRWTGPDPYGGSMSIGDPQSFNRYSYVGNDPENFIDPSGLNMAQCEWRWVIPVICLNGDCEFDWAHAGYARICTESHGGGGGGSGRRGPPPIDGFGSGGTHTRNTSQTNRCGEVNPVGSSFDGLAGLGEGMDRAGGSFRVTNGAYNGSQFSPKWYEIGWGGGSTARISTYSMTRVGSSIATGGTAASIFLGTYEVFSSYSEEGSFGLSTQVTTGRTVGGLTGAWAGGKAGAGIGAAIGLWFDGAGALPGALIGGVIGAVGGSIGGSHAGGETVRGIQDRGKPDRRCP